MVILRGLIYLHNALDSSCIFGLLTSRQNVRLEMEKPIKNQIFWAKNSIEKNLENFDCNICRYIQNLYYISKYTNGHGL